MSRSILEEMTPKKTPTRLVAQGLAKRTLIAPHGVTRVAKPPQDCVIQGRRPIPIARIKYQIVRHCRVMAQVVMGRQPVAKLFVISVDSHAEYAIVSHWKWLRRSLLGFFVEVEVTKCHILGGILPGGGTAAGGSSGGDAGGCVEAFPDTCAEYASSCGTSMTWPGQGPNGEDLTMDQYCPKTCKKC